MGIEAARYLRSKVADEHVKKVFEDKLVSIGNDEAPKQQLVLGLNQRLKHRSAVTTDKEWLQLLAGKGDKERGRIRVRQCVQAVTLSTARGVILDLISAMSGNRRIEIAQVCFVTFG